MSGVKASQGAAFSKIMGIGGYRPRRVVDNAEIVTYIDSSDEWIRTRSGITERRWASPDETVQMMSVSAARTAIERAGLEPGQVDTVIVATVTHLLQTPAIATTIASELGAKNAAAFDINAACAGFCYMVAMADALIRSGASKYVAIIGVERLTDLTDIHDRSTAFIFADGAGAAIMGPSDEPAIGPVVWGSDGEQSDLITQTQPWDKAIPRHERVRPEDGTAEAVTWPTIAMTGNPVFKWASYAMAKTAAEAHGRRRRAARGARRLRAAPGQQPDHRRDVQGAQAAERRRRGPRHHQPRQHLGRLDPPGDRDAARSGEAKSGQTALIIGFGAGLVYAGQVITLP